MEIKTKTEGVVINGNVVEYKQPLKKGSNSTIDLEFTYPQEKKISNFLVTPTCGCTTSNTKIFDNSIKVQLRYDTHRVGVFDKVIRVDYKIDGKLINSIIKLKGEVLQ